MSQHKVGLTGANFWKDEVAQALTRAGLAQNRYGDFASMHEAFGVLAEEVAEFLDAVRLRQEDPTRSEKLRHEALDVAAVALRIAEQVERVKR